MKWSGVGGWGRDGEGWFFLYRKFLGLGGEVCVMYYGWLCRSWDLGSWELVF